MNLQAPVSSLMSKDVISIGPKDKLQVAKDIFGSNNIHHIPVLDEDEKLVGILSKVDYLYFLKPIHQDSNEQYVNNLRLKNYTVGEAMTAQVQTISPDATLFEALELLTENRFHSLPVIEAGKVVGIITSHDFLFRLLRPLQVA